VAQRRDGADRVRGNMMILAHGGYVATAVASVEGKIASNTLPLELCNIQWLDVTTGPFKEQIGELIRNFKTREKDYPFAF